jgi:hypothetical protein
VTRSDRDTLATTRKIVTKSALAFFLVLGLLAVTVVPTAATQRARVGVFIGVGPGYWWGPPYPWWWYPPYYVYPPPYYAYPPPVVYEPPPPQAEPTAYWYYCASAGAYYPTAPTCPEPWIKVPSWGSEAR